jgi:hypothetical protein
MFMRRTLVALAAAAMLSMPMVAGPSSALAAQGLIGDGLVNVQIGNISEVVDLRNADILNNTTVQAAVTACNIDVNAVVAVLSAVDASGKKATVCRTATGQKVTATNA